jgi:hypothetical protein
VAAGSAITVTASVGAIKQTVTVAVVNTQRTISLVTDLPQIPSDGSKSATITALVRDANNNVVASAPVTFQATSGALSGAQAQTDATGAATVKLGAGTDPTNRSITVTATSGTANATINVSVTGTNLTISGPKSLILGQVGSYSAVLVNSAGQGVPGATVTLTSSKGNALSVPSPTNANGQANFTLTASVGGQDTITAAALGLPPTATLVDVSSDNFAFTTPAPSGSPAKVNLGQTQTLTVNWTSGGVVQVNKAVTFTATRGTLSSGNATTDASGNATVTISSTSAGPAIVSAAATGVSAQANLDFVAINPTQIAVQASPTTVAKGNTSTIAATVRDASNNLVEGAAVDFQITNDPTNGGLQLASANTNAQGIATTTYTAGNTSSGANGVTITATVHGSSPAVTGSAQLTVGGQTVFLSLGTGNTIDTTKGVAIYQITYSVFAVDSSGAALANAPISLEVLPVAYGKGVMAGCPGGTTWGPTYTTALNDPYAYPGRVLCRNEDADYTGNIASLDPASISTCTNLANSQVIPGHQKDYNCNGILDPGNIAVVAPSTGITDPTGKLDITITYPRDHSYWVMVSLIAKTTVNGTESTATSTFLLQGAIADYGCAVGPPGPVSPYGVAATCADPR